MAVYTELTLDEASRVTEAHGLGPTTTLVPIAKGSVNTNHFVDGAFGRRFLRVYEEQETTGVAYEWALLDHLVEGGVSLPRRVAGPAPGVCRLHGKPVALFELASGGELRQREVTPETAAEVGAALGLVHRVGASFGWRREGRFRRADLRGRLASAAAHGRPELVEPIARLSALLDELDATEPSGLPRGVTHGDLFRDNVLFDGGHVSALLDWESAADGVLTYDLCVTVLAHAFFDDFRWDVAAAMVRAYDDVRPLSSAEWSALQFQARAAAGRFAITRITDFHLRSGGVGERVMKDYRRFLQRLDAVSDPSAEAFAAALGAPRAV